MEKLTIKRSIWIAAPRERVWQAVTDPVQIAQWFAPGTPISWNGNRISIHVNDMDLEVAVVETVDPPHQLTTFNLPDMTLSTTYLLEEENGGTRFTVIEAGYEALSDQERQERLDQDSGGWERALENLNAFIEGRDLPTPEGF